MSSVDFELGANDKASSTWIRLREHLQSLLVEARTKNDDVNLTEVLTAAQRGRIQLLKSLIALGDDRPMTGDIGGTAKF